MSWPSFVAGSHGAGGRGRPRVSAQPRALSARNNLPEFAGHNSPPARNGAHNRHTGAGENRFYRGLRGVLLISVSGPCKSRTGPDQWRVGRYPKDEGAKVCCRVVADLHLLERERRRPKYVRSLQGRVQFSHFSSHMENREDCWLRTQAIALTSASLTHLQIAFRSPLCSGNTPQSCRCQHQSTFPIRKGANHARSSPDLPHQLFQRVIGAKDTPVFGRHCVVVQSLFNAGLDDLCSHPSHLA